MDESTSEPAALVVSPMVADIRGSVTCNYPCVPECTRAHEWESTK